MKPPKITVGRKDRIDFPDLGYTNVKAKVDTGAYGSAIHCSSIEVIDRDGEEVLSFILLDPEYSQYREERQYFKEFTDKAVKNSGGGIEHRFRIVTDILFLGEKIRTEFTLTDRSEMRYPVLLGRKFLRKRFIVDVGVKDVSYKLKKGKG